MAGATVLAGGTWALFNSIRFAVDAGSRHRAEAAWFIFAAVLLAVGFACWRQVTEGHASERSSLNWSAAAGFVTLSVLLYLPTPGIGLLSDDFVLLERAGAGRLVDPDWDYIRPVPLALWAMVNAIVPSSSVPWCLHLTNVVGHGVNGWLVFEVARGFSLAPRWAAAGGVLFLAAPFSVEPVAWPSGGFDIALTVVVLTSVLVLRSSASRTAVVFGIAMLTLVAVGTKETAVAMPLMLALLVPFAAPGRRQAAAIAVAVSGALVAAYVLWRFSSGSPNPMAGSNSGYELKELLSRPFGAMGYGLHAQTLARWPWLGVLAAAVWPLVVVRSALTWPRDVRPFRYLLLAAGWVICSILPVFTMLYISPELEGSRYLYLGSTFWALAFVQLMASPLAVGARWAMPATVIIVVIGGAVTLMQQAPWRAAGEERERVLAAFADAHAACPPASVENVTDSVGGAYVFRNGFAEAVRRLGLSTTGGECRLRWNGTRFESTN